MAFKIDELFYELDARTAGFEDKITRSQRTLSDFTKFVNDKPILACFALSAAIVAVGVVATKMAADVDREIRRVQAAFPGATAEVGKLKKAVADLSEITPRSQRALAEAAGDIAEKGVESVDEIIRRLRTAALVADASGSDLKGVADAIDLIGDAFRLTDKQAEDALVTIAGFAQGKVALNEVFTTLDRGGRILADLGVTAEDAGRAMVSLIDAGVTTRQAGTVLQTILELTSKTKELRKGSSDQKQAADIIEASLSRENIAAKGFLQALGDLSGGLTKANIDTRDLNLSSNTLSAVTRVAEGALKDHRTAAERLSDSYDRLYKAAQTNNESADALSQLLVNQLNRSFVDLGNIILPTVISGLQKVVDLLREIRGETNVLKGVQTLQGPLPTVAPQSRLGVTSPIQPDAAHANAKKFDDALKDLSTLAQKEGAAGFAGIPKAQLQAVADHIKQLVTAQPDRLRGEDGRALDALVLSIRQAIIADNDSAGGNKGGGGGKPKVAALTDEIKGAIASLRQSMNEALIQGTTTEIDDAIERFKKFKADLEALEAKAGPQPILRAQLAKIEKEPARLEAKERLEAAKEVTDEVARAAGIQSAAMQAALDDYLKKIDDRNKEYEKLGRAPLFSPEQIQRIKDARNALIDAAKAAEEANAEISRVQATALLRRGSLTERGENAGDIVSLQGQLQTELEKLRALEGKKDDESNVKRAAALQRIGAIQGEINTLEQRQNEIIDAGTKKIRDRITFLEEQAAAIQTAIGYAADLAAMFGTGGEKLAGMLRNIGGIARGIGQISPFLKTLDLFKKGGASFGDLVGAAGPIIGGITSAVGLIKGLISNPAVDAARIETNNALKQLTHSLDALRETYLQNVSNTDADKLLKGIDNVLGQVGSKKYTGQQLQDRIQHGQSTTYETFAGNRVFLPGEGNGPGRRGNLRDIGAAFGQDFDSGALERYFAQIDSKYGTNLAEFIRKEDPYGLLEALKQVPEALKTELGNLGRFANDAAGIMARVNFQFDVLGKKDPVEKIRAIVDALTAAGISLGDFTGTFGTLNNPDSTAEERQKAIDDALAKLTGSGPIDFGGLTPEQLRDLLKQFTDALSGTSTTSGTGGYNTDRTITEVTGSRLAAIMSTSQIFLEQIRDANREMVRLLSGGAVASPGLTPPDLERFGGPMVSIGDITVTLGDLTGLDVNAAKELGYRVGGAIVQRLDTALGKNLAWRTRGSGDNTRN